jgi:hypothetical protein
VTETVAAKWNLKMCHRPTWIRIRKLKNRPGCATRRTKEWIFGNPEIRLYEMFIWSDVCICFHNRFGTESEMQTGDWQTLWPICANSYRMFMSRPFQGLCAGLHNIMLRLQETTSFSLRKRTRHSKTIKKSKRVIFEFADSRPDYSILRRTGCHWKSVQTVKYSYFSRRRLGQCEVGAKRSAWTLDYGSAALARENGLSRAVRVYGQGSDRQAGCGEVDGMGDEMGMGNQNMEPPDGEMRIVTRSRICHRNIGLPFFQACSVLYHMSTD